VEVRLRAGVSRPPPLTTCDRAVAEAGRHFQPRGPWTLILTGGDLLHWSEQAGDFAYALALTNFAGRTTIATVGGSDILEHEMCHIRAYQDGEEDDCDKPLRR
jgi:hypothetical protein